MTKLFTKASLCMLLSLLEDQVNGSKAIFHSFMDLFFLNPSSKNETQSKQDVQVFRKKLNTVNTSPLLSLIDGFYKFSLFLSHPFISYRQQFFRFLRLYSWSMECT